MRRNVIIALLMFLFFASIGGLYLRNRTLQERIQSDQKLQQDAVQQADRYLARFIAAVEKGDAREISRLLDSSPENYQEFEGVRMRFLDKKVDREVAGSRDQAAIYLLKFKAEDVNIPENRNFLIHMGFNFMTVRLVRENGDWRISSIGSGEYFE